MKEKSSSAVGIIGGADGPTSVFVAGRTRKLPLKIRIKNSIYKWKSKKAQKRIVAGVHTLEEVIAYAGETYHLTEVTDTQRKRQMLACREMIDRIPDSEMPMDFHIYEIESGYARLEMEIDYKWEIFGISYSGSKKEMKQFKGMARELYLYYGVSEEDIKNKTERYHSLLAILSA